MSPDARRMPRLLATVGRPDLDTHLQYWGRRPAGGPGLIDEIGRSRLGGRGGAGFPAARKWLAVASARRPVVVVNATEGEPASNKDKTLLLHCPHLVLDGASLAAEALGASEVIICIDRHAANALRSVGHAVAERIRHRQDRVPFRIEATPAGYVTGEESALVRWIDGGEARPTFGPRPFERGVGGRATLIQNAETLAHVAIIGRFGSEWFAALGTASHPGTALVTISGDVRHSSVYEVAMGTGLAEIVRPAGPTSPPQAVLIGGYAGSWLDHAAMTAAALDPGSLSSLGATFGCGAIVVVGQESCGLKAVASIAAWLAGQSAGQCGPCVRGLPTVADAVARLVGPGAPKGWNAQIDRWLWMIEGRGACKHPDGAARMIRSGIEAFAAEVQSHRQGGDCRRPAPPLALPRYSEVMV